MKLKIALTTLASCLLCISVSTSAYVGTTAKAEQLIAEFGLREASKAMKSNPSWSPKRIVVTLPAYLSTQLPEFESQLAEVAKNIELVIDRSDNFSPAAESLAGADAIIGVCTPSTLENADASLLWFQNYFVGMDNCKGWSQAQLDNVQFTNTKRLSGPSIAEHTIAMITSLARGFPHYQQAQIERNWQPDLAIKSIGFGQVQGKTLLVAGLGGIGTQIAQRAHALGMKVIATRHSSRTGPDYVDYVGLSDELLTLAGQADIVVNALPLTDKTTGLFDQEFFKRAKAGSIFISVGRGKSTVTNDLIAALKSGKLYGAGLDVTEPEPLPASSELWHLSNVIITPHVSAVGRQSLQRTATLVLENLRRYLAGEALLNPVDLQAGY